MTLRNNFIVRTFTKDNFILGLILGFVAPIVGLLIFRYTKFRSITFQETLQYIIYQPGFNILTAGLSVSLLLSALIFTLYVNSGRDKTAKGIFVTTMIYGLFILIVKTIY